MAKEKRVVILSVRVEDTVAEAIRALADTDNRTLSNYVQILLKKHIDEKGIKAGKAKKDGR